MNSTLKPEKQVFQLKKSRKDGLVLQVHHSIPGRGGDVQRVRFTSAVFDEKGERLAAVDHRGNVFIIDLVACKVWLVPSLGICTVVAYSPFTSNTLVMGTTDCCLNFVNTETGSVTQSLKGHTLPVKQISFSSQRHFCLSVSEEEAIVWDVVAGCAAHRLATRSDVLVKQVLFIPGTDQVLVCFEDDKMNVWNIETLECIRQIVPDLWKGNHLRTIAFTRNGRVMVVGGHSPHLVVFSLDTWSLRNCVPLPGQVGGVKHIEFLPQELDAGANKILALLSTNCTLYFLDLEAESLLRTNLPRDATARRLACSPTGRYVAMLLHSGDVNIYQSSRLLGQVPAVPGRGPEVRAPRRRSLGKQRHALLKQMKGQLQTDRLRPMLKQFGEYPEAYRGLIWRMLSRLPGNQAAFVSLVSRECPLALRDVDHAFPRESRTVTKNLRRVLSCLAHWCPLFAEVEYLPRLALPFVVLFQNNPLDCFEMLVTIILNWCQLWFEYFPCAPTNVLAMVENVLGQHDTGLLQFLCERGVGCELYAWEPLRTGLSQVLSAKEWCVLWDHVLTNEPSFLLMAVVAYNIVCRAAIKTCKSAEDFQRLYHNKNAVDMRRFLAKCYQLLEGTSEDIHPRQYLRPFQALEPSAYPIFSDYAKCTVDHQVELLEHIRTENARLAEEYRAAMEWEGERERRRNRQSLREQHEKRLLCAEEALRAEVLEEEQRVAQQRRRVLELRKELRARDLESVQEDTDHAACRDMQQRQASLARAADLMKLKGCREEAVVATLEDEVRSHVDRQEATRLRQDTGVPESPVEQGRREAREGRDIPSSIAVVERLMEQINQELARQLAPPHRSQHVTDTARKVRQLEEQTRLLEAEVRCLLEKIARRRRKEDTRRDDAHQKQKETKTGEPRKAPRLGATSVRSWDVYRREKQAVKDAMVSREKLLAVPNIARRHLNSLNTS
ncbi:TBC1 domain family member 31 [Bacillus rossius redtenbacheri]|uniref:TBC1 domain family member 31 n=1 Tax=Bacillus rossius redtenbacheri TaxID=93214 RepID=UPI002FDEBA4B